MTQAHSKDYEQLRISGLHAFYGESHILHGLIWRFSAGNWSPFWAATGPGAAQP